MPGAPRACSAPALTGSWPSLPGGSLRLDARLEKVLPETGRPLQSAAGAAPARSSARGAGLQPRRPHRCLSGTPREARTRPRVRDRCPPRPRRAAPRAAAA